MSTLSDKLAEVTAPKKPTPIIEFLNSLSDADRANAWKALRDGQNFKTFTLLRIFNEEGGKFGKESFGKFRTDVLAGNITEESVHGTK